MAKVKVVRSSGTKLVGEFTEALPVRLTNDELLLRGFALAELDEKLRSVTAEVESAKQKFKAAAAELEQTRAGLSSAIRNKQENRPVRVEAYAYYDLCMYRETRSDTGEVIRERALSQQEMQEDLTFAGSTEVKA